MLKRPLFFITVLFLILGALLPPAALAQEGGAVSEPLQGLVVYTPYPTREAAAGKSVTFNFTALTMTEPQVVRLELEGLPEGWTATFRGGGEVIHSVYVRPGEGREETFSLKIDVPGDAATGRYPFTVIAASEQNTVEFPLEIVVTEKAPASLTWDIELPTLKGRPTTTFSFSGSLRNDGDEDLTVNLIAEAPEGFEVTFRSLGQEVSSIPLPAGESKSFNIDVDVPDALPAGQYPVLIRAQGADVSAETTLTADVEEVPGKPELTISTADGRLSADAYAGKETAVKIVVSNSGDAPAKKVKLSSTEPSGWKVEFDPEEIDEIPVDQQVEVTARITPSEKAVAGDYMVTVRGSPEGETTKSVDFRITVRTSTLWGVVGIVLIAVAVGVVAIAVMRFGRR